MTRTLAVLISGLAIVATFACISEHSNRKDEKADAVVIHHDHNADHHLHDGYDHHHGGSAHHFHDEHGNHTHAAHNPFMATVFVNYNPVGEIDMNTFQRGEDTYEWVHCPELGKMPEKMRDIAKGRLHNNADQDPISGEVVTVVAGYGLATLGKNLGEWTLVPGQDPHFAKGMNAHGADCFIHNDDRSLWAFASTNTREVVISRGGEIISILRSPKGDEFENQVVNDYYKEGGAFAPCDVVYNPKAKILTVVTGYSDGDFVLTAVEVDGNWVWGDSAWGGRKGKFAGGFLQTGHGIQTIVMPDGTEAVEIASRAPGEIFGKTPHGKTVLLPGVKEGEVFIKLPDGSNPCNIFVNGGERFMPFLNPIAGTKGKAPVFITKDGEKAGMLVPGLYETLELMVHMHGACVVEYQGDLYAIVLSWRNGRENGEGKPNDGMIAIFKAVKVEKAAPAA